MSAPIVPCLWFDYNAEEAIAFYTSIFKDSRVGEITRYPDDAPTEHGHRPGAVLTIAFELNGQRFVALNGGPNFKFTEAVSFQVECDDQQEIDYYWDRLGDGGDPECQQCGWLKDRFGLSWQIVPRGWSEMLTSSNPAGRSRYFMALGTMKKLEIARLRAAFAGEA
jgi:predicted 3-demethylubiquinone-9 3-methyltransferase (glyoxalase superfamily)